MDSNLTEKKTILLLIPNVGFGGAERVFHDHSVALSKEFHIIECVFNTEGEQAYVSGNEVISLDVPGGGGLVTKLKNFFLRCYRLKAIKKHRHIHACVSHLEGADYINLLTKGSEKVILCIHGSKLHDKNIAGVMGWVRKKLLIRFLYNRADKIITVSRDINAELTDELGVLPSKVQTINNFFDIEKIITLSSEPIGVEYTQLFGVFPILITSGRLALQKNQLSLLEVFASLKKKQPTVRLVVVGDGELRESLVNTCEELGLSSYKVWESTAFSTSFDVYFLGYQSNPFKFLAKADVFVFPSSWEGFPMALSEAMICGLPVVSSDCPTGPREILAPSLILNQEIEEPKFAEYGILMPLLNNKNESFEIKRELWVSSLDRILNDKSMRMHYAKQSHGRMHDFSKDKIISSWIALLAD